MKLVAILMVLMVPAVVYGGATISLTSNRLYYLPDQDIVLTLNVNTSEGWNGFDTALAASTLGLKIKSRTILMPAGTYWELGAPVDPLNDLNTVKADLGLFNIGANPWPAGDNATQTIVISQSYLYFGLIVFSFADPGAGIQVAGLVGELTPLSLVSLTVRIVPEPTSLLLMALGGILLHCRLPKPRTRRSSGQRL